VIEHRLIVITNHWPLAELHQRRITPLNANIYSLFSRERLLKSLTALLNVPLLCLVQSLAHASPCAFLMARASANGVCYRPSNTCASVRSALTDLEIDIARGPKTVPSTEVARVIFAFRLAPGRSSVR